MAAETHVYDVLVLGRGAAAYSAALYAARYRLSTAMFGAEFGGETALGGVIENYPGAPSIDGYELMQRMKQQVDHLEVPTIEENVTELRRGADCWEARAGDVWYQAPAVILAMGRERRKLGVARERELIGKGVSYCSTCDAPLYKGRRAVVVGGGDAAVKGSLLVSKYATEVYLVYRGDRFFRPEPIALQRLQETRNLHVMLKSVVVELKGKETVTGVVIKSEDGARRTLAADGVFVEIGADPNSGIARAAGVAVNDQNEIIVDPAMRTNLPGLLAAGDISNASGPLKQTVTAAAQGAIAANSAYAHVTTQPHQCATHAVGYQLD